MKTLNSPLYGKITFNEPLSLHTSMKVGGPARMWVEPQTAQQLCALARDANKLKISVFTIGAASNIIVADKNIDLICARLSAPAFNKIEFNGAFIKTGAGVLLGSLLASAAGHSLGGAEFLAGIPGTVGGAIAGNAGSRNETISSPLKEIEVVDSSGKIKKIKKEDIKFGYRYLNIHDKIIISALFKFKKKDKRLINALIKKYLKNKMQKQDYATPSAGCIFKNPKAFIFSAGELIESCGLKGKILGGAEISRRHANFIINRNNARAQDVLALIELIKRKVKDDYGICLEEEVRIIK